MSALTSSSVAERSAGAEPPNRALPDPKENECLGLLLTRPPVALDVTALPRHWRRTVITIRCARPPGLEDGPWLTVALRGAFGHGLRRVVAEPGRADGAFPRTSALSALFRRQAMLTGRLEVPKPFVLAVDGIGNELEIRLTLFGVGGYWRQLAYLALLHALDLGVRLKEHGRFRVALPAVAASWHRTETIAVPEWGERVSIRLLTPLRLPAGRALGTRLDDFIFSLVDRVSGLARWQGVRLETDWGGWRRLAQGLRFERVDLRPERWSRRSSLQRRTVPMAGLVGHFEIAGPPAAVLPLLALGATTHAGAHAAFGLGRFDVLCW